MSNNQKGKNQWGVKNCNFFCISDHTGAYSDTVDPPDDILGPALHKYARDGLNKFNAHQHLLKDFSLSIGLVLQ